MGRIGELVCSGNNTSLTVSLPLCICVWWWMFVEENKKTKGSLQVQKYIQSVSPCLAVCVCVLYGSVLFIAGYQ